MILNATALTNLGIGFKTTFQRGLGMAAPQYLSVATVVPSTTGKEEYGWLGKMKGMREWLGDRVLNSIANHKYSIDNRDWEDTIEVDRNHIQDDNLGQYSLLFQEMGEATAAHPNQLVFGLLKQGFTTPCYDGQYYFDTDHPVLDENGVAQSVSNTGGGSGTPWFLMDASRTVKPIIFQERQKPVFVSRDDLRDENVFMRKKFLYGVDARYNAGFAYWQFAYGSKQTLDKAAFATGFAAIENMKGDFGRPLGLKPTKLVVPPSLREAALEILNAERDAAGATNVWKGQVELEVSPWLA
ncbi:MAG: hypothetical protein CVT77_06560 [Alphaproteobacteria bacterium HGW-Alphaproteobacteria-16]|nr:MAG: hypothetical protein CVT77_06560 [Alphaproteobacteria bacterium HGW-Alphaproteobacteria-16]